MRNPFIDAIERGHEMGVKDVSRRAMVERFGTAAGLDPTGYSNVRNTELDEEKIIIQQQQLEQSKKLFEYQKKQQMQQLQIEQEQEAYERALEERKLALKKDEHQFEIYQNEAETFYKNKQQNQQNIPKNSSINFDNISTVLKAIRAPHESSTFPPYGQWKKIREDRQSRGAQPVDARGTQFRVAQLGTPSVDARGTPSVDARGTQFRVAQLGTPSVDAQSIYNKSVPVDAQGSGTPSVDARGLGGTQFRDEQGLGGIPQPGSTQPEDAQPGSTQPEDAQYGGTQPEDAQYGGIQPEDARGIQPVDAQGSGTQPVDAQSISNKSIEKFRKGTANENDRRIIAVTAESRNDGVDRSNLIKALGREDPNAIAFVHKNYKVFSGFTTTNNLGINIDKNGRKALHVTGSSLVRKIDALRQFEENTNIYFKVASRFISWADWDRLFGGVFESKSAQMRNQIKDGIGSLLYKLRETIGEKGFSRLYDTIGESQFLSNEDTLDPIELLEKVQEIMLKIGLGGNLVFVNVPDDTYRELNKKNSSLFSTPLPNQYSINYNGSEYNPDVDYTHLVNNLSNKKKKLSNQDRIKQDDEALNAFSILSNGRGIDPNDPNNKLTIREELDNYAKETKKISSEELKLFETVIKYGDKGFLKAISRDAPITEQNIAEAEEALRKELNNYAEETKTISSEELKRYENANVIKFEEDNEEAENDSSLLDGNTSFFKAIVAGSLRGFTFGAFTPMVAWFSGEEIEEVIEHENELLKNNPISYMVSMGLGTLVGLSGIKILGSLAFKATYGTSSYILSTAMGARALSSLGKNIKTAHNLIAKSHGIKKANFITHQAVIRQFGTKMGNKLLKIWGVQRAVNIAKPVAKGAVAGGLGLAAEEFIRHGGETSKLSENIKEGALLGGAFGFLGKVLVTARRLFQGGKERARESVKKLISEQIRDLSPKELENFSNILINKGNIITIVPVKRLIEIYKQVRKDFPEKINDFLDPLEKSIKGTNLENIERRSPELFETLTRLNKKEIISTKKIASDKKDFSNILVKKLENYKDRIDVGDLLENPDIKKVILNSNSAGKELRELLKNNSNNLSPARINEVITILRKLRTSGAISGKFGQEVKEIEENLLQILNKSISEFNIKFNDRNFTSYEEANNYFKELTTYSKGLEDAKNAMKSNNLTETKQDIDNFLDSLSSEKQDIYKTAMRNYANSKFLESIAKRDLTTLRKFENEDFIKLLDIQSLTKEDFSKIANIMEDIAKKKDLTNKHSIEIINSGTKGEEEAYVAKVIFRLFGYNALMSFKTVVNKLFRREKHLTEIVDIITDNKKGGKALLEVLKDMRSSGVKISKEDEETLKEIIRNLQKQFDAPSITKEMRKDIKKIFSNPAFWTRVKLGGSKTEEKENDN